MPSITSNDKKLFKACCDNDPTALLKLLQQRADPNTEVEGTTALQAATARNNFECVQLLVKYDVDCLVVSEISGNTALCDAIELRHAKCELALMNHLKKLSTKPGNTPEKKAAIKTELAAAMSQRLSKKASEKLATTIIEKTFSKEEARSMSITSTTNIGTTTLTKKNGSKKASTYFKNDDVSDEQRSSTNRSPRQNSITKSDSLRRTTLTKKTSSSTSPSKRKSPSKRTSERKSNSFNSPQKDLNKASDIANTDKSVDKSDSKLKARIMKQKMEQALGQGSTAVESSPHSPPQPPPQIEFDNTSSLPNTSNGMNYQTEQQPAGQQMMSPQMMDMNGQQMMSPQMMGTNGQQIMSPQMMGMNGQQMMSPQMMGMNGQQMMSPQMMGMNSQQMMSPQMMGMNGQQMMSPQMIGMNGQQMMSPQMMGMNGQQMMSPQMMGMNGQQMMGMSGQNMGSFNLDADPSSSNNMNDFGIHSPHQQILLQNSPLSPPSRKGPSKSVSWNEDLEAFKEVRGNSYDTHSTQSRGGEELKVIRIQQANEMFSELKLKRRADVESGFIVEAKCEMLMGVKNGWKGKKEVFESRYVILEKRSMLLDVLGVRESDSIPYQLEQRGKLLRGSAVYRQFGLLGRKHRVDIEAKATEENGGSVGFDSQGNEVPDDGYGDVVLGLQDGFLDQSENTTGLDLNISLIFDDKLDANSFISAINGNLTTGDQLLVSGEKENLSNRIKKRKEEAALQEVKTREAAKLLIGSTEKKQEKAESLLMFKEDVESRLNHQLFDKNKGGKGGDGKTGQHQSEVKLLHVSVCDKDADDSDGNTKIVDDVTVKHPSSNSSPPSTPNTTTVENVLKATRKKQKHHSSNRNSSHGETFTQAYERRRSESDARKHVATAAAKAAALVAASKEASEKEKEKEKSMQIQSLSFENNFHDKELDKDDDASKEEMKESDQRYSSPQDMSSNPKACCTIM